MVSYIYNRRGVAWRGVALRKMYINPKIPFLAKKLLLLHFINSS